MLAMATDYAKLEKEMREEKAKLERQLHMQNIRRLSAKKRDLAKAVIQRKQIETLKKQTEELESKVSTVYCPQHALNDHEIKGYLVYLLQMKDFFKREVDTKEEKLRQLDFQIKSEFRKQCEYTREQAGIIKNKPKKTPDFIFLENMSNKLEQMNKRVSTLRQENKEIMENITNLRKSQKQFKKIETDFRRKIDDLRSSNQKVLERTVAYDEETDELMAKSRVFQERCTQDKRKTAIIENALNLCLQRTDMNDAFAKMQATMITDTRIAKAIGMIKEEVTGLEPGMERIQDLHTAICTAAGESTPEKMKESVRVADNYFEMTFSYLDELFKDIDHLQSEINILRKGNKRLTKSISSTDRNLLMEIKLNQDEAQKKREEADEASKRTEEAKAEFNSMLGMVKALIATCCPENAHYLEETPIDETNVTDFLQAMEHQLLDYLISHEFQRMEVNIYILIRKNYKIELSDGGKPVIIEEVKDDETDGESQRIEHAGIVETTLLSKTHLPSLTELESEKSFPEVSREQAMTALAEVQSDENGDEIDKSN